MPEDGFDGEEQKFGSHMRMLSTLRHFNLSKLMTQMGNKWLFLSEFLRIREPLGTSLSSWLIIIVIGLKGLHLCFNLVNKERHRLKEAKSVNQALFR